MRVSTSEYVPFKLSEWGPDSSQDPSILEYLNCYHLPKPPNVRYGYTRFPSPHPKHSVGIFGQAWIPQGATATILFVHGYSEHTGNYGRLIDDFVKAKFAVMAMDLRGHGLSEGAHGHAETPTIYPEDVEAFAALVFPHIMPSRPLFLWGHSLGGQICLQLLQRKKLPVAPKAATLCSPFLGIPPLYGVQKVLSYFTPVISALVPSAPLDSGLVPSDLTHDQDYLAERAKDPLIFTVVTPKWFQSMLRSTEEIQSHHADYASGAPILMMLAGDERITNLSAARRFAFTALSSIRHKVLEFPGYRHELEKEPEIRERVVKESLSWFKGELG